MRPCRSSPPQAPVALVFPWATALQLLTFWACTIGLQASCAVGLWSCVVGCGCRPGCNVQGPPIYCVAAGAAPRLRRPLLASPPGGPPARLILQIGKACFDRCSWQWSLLLATQAAMSLALPLVLWWRRYHAPAAAEGGGSLSAPSDGAAEEAVFDGAEAAPDWSASKMLLAIAVSFFAGLLGGLLGIGGGTLMGPLLLGE